METVKLTSIGLLALLSTSSYAAATEPVIELSPPDPESITWETTRPGCWRAGNCLVADISFSNTYPKAFYETDKFTYAVIATSVAAAATVTVMTAGAGAPAVVPGTSSLIVLVGGGGQGAYMAGLSTIGSLIGSNAVGGAAILNATGAIIGVPAATKSVAFGSLAFKTMIGVSAAAYDGILIGENKVTGDLTFVTELRLPTEIGSGWVQDLVTSVYDNEENAGKALNKGNDADFERYLSYQQADLRRGVRALERCWTPVTDCSSQLLTRDDLITLAIMAYRAGRFDLFHQTIDYLKRQTVDTDKTHSFLNYLYATSLLMQSKLDEARPVLLEAIDQERNAIEPALLYIVYLAYDGFEKHEAEIESRVRILKRKFKDDSYDTGYSLATVYFRLGTIYATNGRHSRAIEHLERARSELNYVQKWPIFARIMNQQFRVDIELAMANSYFLSGKKTRAGELFEKLYEDEADEPRKQVLRQNYVGFGDRQAGGL